MENLSADEVDILLQAMRIGGVASGTRQQQQPAKQYKSLRLYDFRSPDKFSKEQLRTLLLLHENFARVLTTSLSAMLRTTVQVTPTLAEQCPYSHFVRGISDPTVLGILTIDPFPGNALLEIDPQAVFPLIDRLLGGPGQGGVTGRGITDIEATVVRRIFNSILEGMAEAWRNVTEVRPRLEALETNPLFAQLVSPAEMVAYLVFSLQVGHHGGEMKLCLPYILLEPVLPQLTARHWMIKDPRHKAGGEPEKLAKELSEVPVPLSVELGRASVTVGDLLNLETGDIIPLDTPTGAMLDIYVKGRKKFRGKPGKVGRRLAIQVLGLSDEGEWDNE